MVLSGLCALSAQAALQTFTFNGSCNSPSCGNAPVAFTAILVLDNYAFSETASNSFGASNFKSFTVTGISLMGSIVPWNPSGMHESTGSFTGTNLNDLNFSVNLVTNPIGFENPDVWYFINPSDTNDFEFGYEDWIPDTGPLAKLDAFVLSTTTVLTGTGTWSTTRQSTDVPEPGSLLLMGGALAALGLAQRRKSNRRRA